MPLLYYRRSHIGRRLSKHEETLHQQVCRYLKATYPGLIFRTDFTAGRIKLSENQGRKYAALQSGRAFPDLFIVEPRTVRGHHYCGLALELKREGTTIIIKRGPRKGHLVADEHIREQVEMCRKLKKRGYYATIACGYDQACEVIDWYMGKPKQLTLPDDGLVF